MKRFAALVCGLAVSWAGAQGLLPPRETQEPAVSDHRKPVLIGQLLADDLMVKDSDGTRRTLLSYKAPTDLLVVLFVSGGCASNASVWPALRRLYDRYKGWHVSFLAIGQAALPETLQKERLPLPVARDTDGSVARRLKVSVTPLVLIADEGSTLRYRGPAQSADPALNTLIGHVGSVDDPEPPVPNGCPAARSD